MTFSWKFLATAGYNATIELFNIETWDQVKHFKVPDCMKIDCVRFSEDERGIAYTADHLVVYSAIDTNGTISQPKYLRGHTKHVRCLAFDKVDTSILYSGGEDRSIRIWNLKEEKEIN